MEVDGYELYAEPVEKRARRRADELDNVFGNILRGNNLDGVAVVLEEDGEELESVTVDGEKAAVDAAYELVEDYGLDAGVLDYEALER
ncbi:MAG: hypothetical protein ABEJ98_04855 [Candidatus Nanohaloarchaea archaeon]